MNGYDPKSTALLLSIGTGQIPISRFEKGPLKKYFGYINAARKLASDAEKTHRELAAEKGYGHLSYYRFNVPSGKGLDKIKLDEWKSPRRFGKSRQASLGKCTLRKIQKATEEYCETPQVRTQLKQVAQKLVDHRKKRNGHSLWPLVSRGEQYRCTVKKCRESQELKARRGDLEKHLKERHVKKGHIRQDEVEEYLKAGKCPIRTLELDRDLHEAHQEVEA
jgi:hypothetical protein